MVSDLTRCPDHHDMLVFWSHRALQLDKAQVDRSCLIMGTRVHSRRGGWDFALHHKQVVNCIIPAKPVGPQRFSRLSHAEMFINRVKGRRVNA
jgi:hypothetical protein